MKKHFKKIIFCVVFLSCFLMWGNASAANWYVDNEASGSDNGTSWTNAWPSFASIIWASIQPGDALYISGGTESKTYSERLVIGASGTSGNVITIQVGQEEGHTGVVVIDGTSVGAYPGISIAAKNYVKVSGQVGSGSATNIKVQNFTLSGISITGASSNIEIAYMETEQNNRGLGAAYGLYVVTTTLANGLQADIHHCKFHNSGPDAEIRFYQTYTGTRTSYDQIKFHHNDVYDSHADWVTLQAEGVSFYNNTIRDRGTYLNDHPDGIQAWGGYCKIYNNKFYGFHRADDYNANSYMRFNPQTSNNPNPAYIWIYNNLFYETLPLSFEEPWAVVTHNGLTYTCKRPHVSNGDREPGVGVAWTTYWDQTGTGGTPWVIQTDYNMNVRRGIELSPQPGTTLNHLYFMNNTMVGTNWFGLFLGFESDHTTANVSDIIIANNLFKDCSMTTSSSYGANNVISLGNGGDGSITYGKWGDSVDVIFDYNTVYASSADWTTNSQWSETLYSWVNFLAQSGTNTSPDNAVQNPLLDDDYTLTSSSPYKDTGVDLSAYFTTDKDGNARSNWSIGAYEYTGADDIVAPAAPTNLSIN